MVQDVVLLGARLGGVDASPCGPAQLRLDDADQSRKRPDILISFPTRSAPVLYDVAVCHPLAATYFSKYGQAGSAANIRGAQKVAPSLYVTRAHALGYEVEPFTIETYGAWGTGARECLDRITKAAADAGCTNTARKGSWGAPHLTQLIRQMVSCALVKGISKQLRIAHLKRAKHLPTPCTHEFFTAPGINSFAPNSVLDLNLAPQTIVHSATQSQALALDALACSPPPPITLPTFPIPIPETCTDPEVDDITMQASCPPPILSSSPTLESHAHVPLPSRSSADTGPQDVCPGRWQNPWPHCTPHLSMVTHAQHYQMPLGADVGLPFPATPVTTTTVGPSYGCWECPTTWQRVSSGRAVEMAAEVTCLSSVQAMASSPLRVLCLQANALASVSCLNDRDSIGRNNLNTGVYIQDQHQHNSNSHLSLSPCERGRA